jgi:uncharacterized RDD family membrane protein YckC
LDPTAVMGRRIGAYFIDAIIGTIVFVAAFFVLSDSVETSIDICEVADSGTLCFYSGGTTYLADGGEPAAIFALTLGFWLFMGWIIQGIRGGTPGKLLVGLRVVRQDSGELAGLTKCLLRTVLWLVDGQPFGLPLVGLITGLVTKGHRRVGDMVAATMVVKKTSVGIAPAVPGLTTPPGYVSAPPPHAAVTAPGPPLATRPIQPVADGITAPKWDVDRNTYIQWDPQLTEWMMFDQAAQQWKRIV